MCIIGNYWSIIECSGGFGSAPWQWTCADMNGEVKKAKQLQESECSSQKTVGLLFTSTLFLPNDRQWKGADFLPDLFLRFILYNIKINIQ